MLSMGLAGCGSVVRTETRFVTPSIPPELMACHSAPDAPEGLYTQRDVAVYITQLYGAWDDCHRTVNGFAEALRAFEEEIADE